MSINNKKKFDTNLKFVYSDNNTLSVIFHDNDLLMGVVGEFNKNLKELEKVTKSNLYSRGNSILIKSSPDTNEVIKAASTKWNFIKFTPGLVGGHCIVCFQCHCNVLYCDTLEYRLLCHNVQGYHMIQQHATDMKQCIILYDIIFLVVMNSLFEDLDQKQALTLIYSTFFYVTARYS